MTAQPSVGTMVRSEWRRDWNDDARQLVAVIVVAVIALALGYGVRSVATSATHTVSVGNVSASIPTTWIFQPGAQSLLFTAVDPRNPGQRYSVTRPGGTDLATVSDTSVAAKSQVLTEFQLVGRETVSINGTNSPSVTYVYVTSRNGGIPQVIEGRDIFLPGTGGVLVVSLESPTKSFDNAQDTFLRFAASVKG
jgi:hypothetical protein